MAYEIIAGRGSKERERFGLDGTIFIGKNYVQFGKDISLANPIHLDIANPHVILVAGKRGSGKSYTLSTIAEGMLDLPKEIGKNISTIIFDTLGIFWTMKYPNYRDDAILREWNLTPKNYSPVIYVPFGLFKTYQEKGIPIDLPFALKPNEVSAESWAEMFNIDLISGEGTLIERRGCGQAPDDFGKIFARPPLGLAPGAGRHHHTRHRGRETFRLQLFRKGRFLLLREKIKLHAA